MTDQSFETMSLEDLQRRRLELEQQQAELDRLFRQRHREARQDFLREIRELIHDRGYAIEEIAEQLVGRRRRSEGLNEGRRYIDPDNADNYYKRGPMPPWLRDKMIENGFNPESRSQRETFKAKHLKLVEE